MDIKTGIPKDKLIHIIVGLFMSIWTIPDAHFSIGWGFGGWLICLVVAYVIKEVIYDRILKKGTYEVLDAVYTMFFPTVFLIVDIIQKTMS